MRKLKEKRGLKPAASSEPSGLVPVAEYRSALALAEAGDRAALATVRRAFDEDPERWRELGNVARVVKHSMATAAAGKVELARNEAYVRTIDAKAAEIRGPNASPLEVILAERIAITWFESMHLDAVIAQNSAAGVRARDLDALDERRHRAHRRLVHAVRELASLRRLLRLSLRVNVHAGIAQVKVGVPPDSGVSAGSDGEGRRIETRGGDWPTSRPSG
jgi:hypothetical protein